ncbi:MAG: CBS domain-containing protein [Pseudomonadales bacterium]|nr:CBS domain-containing protein [Pseudomonadales bacterium]
MNEDRGRDVSWWGRLTAALSGEPQNRNDLLELIQSASERGIVDAEALSIIESTLQVSERLVREIMVPRAQMVSIRDDEPLQDFLPLLLETAHSRFPVLADDDSDEVVGILFAKDLLRRLLVDHQDKFQLKDYLRPALYVPETMHLDRLIREFRVKQSHMAIVVNEYGGVVGLVTLEDALEQIIGDIADEHDQQDEEEDALIREISPGEFIVQAITPLDEFNECFETHFSNHDFDTIGGIITNAFERLPLRDESIQLGGLNFLVLAADSRMLRQLKVSVLS